MVSEVRLYFLLAGTKMLASICSYPAGCFLKDKGQEFGAADCEIVACTQVNGMLLEGRKVFVGPFLKRSERPNDGQAHSLPILLLKSDMPLFSCLLPMVPLDELHRARPRSCEQSSRWFPHLACVAVQYMKQHW